MQRDDDKSAPHADDDDAADDLTPEDRDRADAKRRHDELLDEGVEETFPASDPVAVKHIT